MASQVDNVEETANIEMEDVDEEFGTPVGDNMNFCGVRSSYVPSTTGLQTSRVSVNRSDDSSTSKGPPVFRPEVKSLKDAITERCHIDIADFTSWVELSTRVYLNDQKRVIEQNVNNFARELHQGQALLETGIENAKKLASQLIMTTNRFQYSKL